MLIAKWNNYLSNVSITLYMQEPIQLVDTFEDETQRRTNEQETHSPFSNVYEKSLQLNRLWMLSYLMSRDSSEHITIFTRRLSNLSIIIYMKEPIQLVDTFVNETQRRTNEQETHSLFSDVKEKSLELNRVKPNQLPMPVSSKFQKFVPSYIVKPTCR